MKKLIMIFSIMLCFLMFSVNTFAEDTSAEVNNASTKITVTFKAGTGDYTVDGKKVKAEASVVTGGRTFLPVKVITDALGATLSVDLKAKTAKINYNGVEIKLTDKKAEAVIAGKTVKIDAAPYIKNSVFMASVSFLADTLGADVTNKNGQITFVKEIANPNSIIDFGTLLKKTTKQKVGDSYYKWSMLLPDELKLQYRNFNGTTNLFEAADGSYSISLYIYDAVEDESLESISNDILDYMYDYTLIDYGIKTGNNLDFLEFVYNDSDYTYQERIYIAGKRVFDITISTKNDNTYLEDKYQEILESFDDTFKKDGSTEDLSDVSANGYRKYQDNKLKWSINLPPELVEYKDKNVQNKVNFYGDNNFQLLFRLYSLEKGETLESVTKASIKRDGERLNPKLYKVLKQESVTLGGVKANKVYYSIQFPDEIRYGCDVFLVGKNYKYILSYEMSEEDYKNSKQFKLVEGMINSFNMQEPDVKTVGKLLDPNKVVISEKMKNVSNDIFTMSIPSSWNKEVDTELSKKYSNDTMSVSIAKISLDGISYTDFIKGFDSIMTDSEGMKVELKESVSEKGHAGKKYIVYINLEGIEYRVESYIINKGDSLIFIDLRVDNLYYGSQNAKILSDIWQSITLK